MYSVSPFSNRKSPRLFVYLATILSNKLPSLNCDKRKILAAERHRGCKFNVNEAFEKDNAKSRPICQHIYSSSHAANVVFATELICSKFDVEEEHNARVKLCVSNIDLLPHLRRGTHITTSKSKTLQSIVNVIAVMVASILPTGG